MYEYCKSCVHDKGGIGFCDKCGYTYLHRKYGLSPTEYEAKPKPITNADRIRAMTDEELAEWASAITLDEFGDKKDWLDWLREEAKE